MSVQVQCPNPDCRASFSVSDAEVGRPGHCVKCGQTFSLFSTRGSDAPRGGDTGPAWVPPPRPSELAEGATFGRYRILRRLGRGGMGSVYLAHDTQLERDVALKIPHFTAAESPEVVQRFTREARALARFDHPNICPVFDVGQIDGVPFLTMPYIEGRPLSELVTRPPLPERRAAEVVRTLARALAEAHARGIVHRDLKPSNVLICPRRELVILDFGLARRVEASDSRLTKAGAVLGTPAYMAPEQVVGDVEALGPSCDIYSLGVILYELLTGQLPFEGPAAVVLGLVMVAEPHPPSAYRPNLDRRLEAICRLAMAKKIQDRYASMASMVEALDAFLTDVPSAGPALEDRGHRSCQLPEDPSPKRPTEPPAGLAPAERGHRSYQLPEDPSPKEATGPSAGLEPEDCGHRSDQLPEDLSPKQPAALNPEEAPRRRLAARRLGRVAAGLTSVGLLGAVIWIATDSGTVRIDVQDPNVVVLIDGGEVRIDASGHPMRLRAGEHQLRATRDGSVVETRTFQVRRDGETVLVIRSAPKFSPVMNARPQPAPMPPPEGQLDQLLGLSPHSPAVKAEQQPTPPAPEMDITQPLEQSARQMRGVMQALERIRQLSDRTGMPPSPETGIPPPPLPPAAGAPVSGPPPKPVMAPAPDPAAMANVERRSATRPPSPRPAPPDADRPVKELTNSIGMTLVLVPAGEFAMGSPGSDPDASADEMPQHRVRISTPFYLSKYEVTQDQYEQVMGDNPSAFKGDGRLPVERVTWFDAVAFCNKLSEREKLAPYYEVAGLEATILGGNGYRLPSEAEWEYACRAGTTTRYSFGDDATKLGDYAWYEDNSKVGGTWQTHPVGQKKPNAWGLHDMYGNVQEWCWDWFDLAYYKQMSKVDPIGPETGVDGILRGERVLRGGSHLESSKFLRSAFRFKGGAATRPGYGGCRPARTDH